MKVRTMKVARITNPLSIPTVFVMVFLLVGCGSDSDDSTTSNTGAVDTQERETGVFLDSPVSNLHYDTDTLSGETNAAGEFHYREGEMVSFSIGNIMFGEAMGQPTITPLDLVPEAKNDPYHPTVTNMVKFMLTIDADGDPNNGIQISSTVKEGAQGHFFSFDMPVSEFETNSDILTFIGQMTNTSQMMSTEIAMPHFQETLDSMGPGNMEGTMMGVFMDDLVSGLHYTTDTVSGITNEDGEFHYMEGEMVTFSVGNTMFGQAMGKSVMTPLDLVPSAENASHPTITNMVKFMLTIDSDSDSTNGVHIDGITRGMAYGHSLDFDMPMSDFESNPELLDFISQMPHASHMVNTEEAQEHFQGTLDSMGPGMGMGSGNMGMGN